MRFENPTRFLDRILEINDRNLVIQHGSFSIRSDRHGSTEHSLLEAMVKVIENERSGRLNFL